MIPELHVPSIPTMHGLSHLIRTDSPSSGGSAPPVYTLATRSDLIPSRLSAQKDTNEDDGESDTSSTTKRGTSMEKQQQRAGSRASWSTSLPLSSLGKRETSDDGPEPKTLARSLFLYGFRESSIPFISLLITKMSN